MAWTTMHFGVGMAGGAMLFGAGCLFARKGWRWLPLAMTLGGIWANIPDMPRLFRVDFPFLNLTSTLGSMAFERSLHRWGNIFFGHKALDIQPHDYAIHGLIIVLILYNAAIVLLMCLPRKSRSPSLAKHKGQSTKCDSHDFRQAG
ncbi:MAG: hypothetical protein IT440_12250 [Phycisphaeraceae bacterium]|nr:hypothetical protein [Phycisphaeraceae bacterium]